MFKKLWSHICSDWIRVVMALALAILIYLLRSDIFSTRNEIREISGIPVKLEYPNSNIINLDNKKYTASLTVEGSPQRISRLTSDQIQISVDITRKHFLSGLVELTEKNIKTPFGIHIRKINTPRLTVNLELIESKKVPVRATFDSLKKLSENYSVQSTSIFPQEVIISGPKSKLDNITEVNTIPIPIDASINDSFKYTADISPIDGVATAPSKVKCEINIIQNYNKRTLKKVPVALLLPSGKTADLKYKLAPATVDIEFSGPSRVVHFLDSNAFDIFVNAKEITKAGEYILHLRCAARSPEVKIISITPVQLTLIASDKNQ